MSRSVGIKRDLRVSRNETYANYYYLNFRGYVGAHGDCYDRFLIRMNEMCESTNIVNQVIGKLTKFNTTLYKKGSLGLNFSGPTAIAPHLLLKYTAPDSFNRKTFNSSYTSMEELITHFKY
jgi:NADH:ubiquinone oxidoreductase subunit D